MDLELWLLSGFPGCSAQTPHGDSTNASALLSPSHGADCLRTRPALDFLLTTLSTNSSEGTLILYTCLSTQWGQIAVCLVWASNLQVQKASLTEGELTQCVSFSALALVLRCGQVWTLKPNLEKQPHLSHTDYRGAPFRGLFLLSLWDTEDW